jgi:hypothetical protein
MVQHFNKKHITGTPTLTQNTATTMATSWYQILSVLWIILPLKTQQKTKKTMSKLVQLATDPINNSIINLTSLGFVAFGIQIGLNEIVLISTLLVTIISSFISIRSNSAAKMASEKELEVYKQQLKLTKLEIAEIEGRKTIKTK